MPEKKMPQRPKQHRREDRSRMVFESVIPESWHFEPKSVREYGIDGHVEIFDEDDATGLTFNVQLKGSDNEVWAKAKIKTTTRNYWKELASPTLVVVVDGSDTVRYQWAHTLDVYGRRKNASTYEFTMATEWDDDSAAHIDREVRASAALRDIRSNLPIHWAVTTGPILKPAWVASFKAALERGLDGQGELTRRAEKAGPVRLDISADPDAVSIRLPGGPGLVIHFTRFALDSQDPVAVASDVMLGMAMELERAGLDVLAAALIEAAIPASSMIVTDADAMDFALSRVALAGRGDAALALIERVYLDEAVPFRSLAPIILFKSPGRLTGAMMSQIAERIAAEAISADGSLAGEYYYNAGNIIRRWNRERGLELYDLAADRFPEYRDREYWWRERGSIYLDSGNCLAAIEAYQKAESLGDTTAIPLLADAYAADGQYKSAIETWERRSPTSRYLWELKHLSLYELIGELGVTEQNRDLAGADALFQVPGSDGVDVLALDALHIGGLWRAGVERRDSGKPGFFTFYAAAAAFAVSSPLLWFEALVALQAEFGGSASMQSLIILTAKQECGEEFRRFIAEDEFVPEAARQKILDLIDLVEVPPLAGFVIRQDGKPIDA